MKLTTKELYKLYNIFLTSSPSSRQLTGYPGEFLTFQKIWKASDVIKIPSGYLRVEKYPKIGVGTLHGIFLKNPYRDRQEIENMVYLYLEEEESIDRLELHVPRRFKGIHKFLKPYKLDSIDLPTTIIYLIRGRI